MLYFIILIFCFKIICFLIYTHPSLGCIVVWGVGKLGRVVCNNSTPPATILFLFNDYFFSSGQGQGCPVALKVGRCASTFRR